MDAPHKGCDFCPNRVFFPEKYGFHKTMVTGTDTFSQNAAAIRVINAC